jgi:hypothetical protein
MQQIDSDTYNVVQGEDVTLTGVAHTVNEDLAVSLDGTTVPKSSSRPAIYKFTITKAADAQFLVISCHFTAGDAPNAFYQFSLASKDGGSFNAGSVRKADSDWDSVKEFRLP